MSEKCKLKPAMMFSDHMVLQRGKKLPVWVYGSGQQEITIIDLEPHPENAKNGAYDRIALSDLPLS